MVTRRKRQNHAENVGTLFRMLRDEMILILKETARKELRAAVSFRKEQNGNPGMISPTPFNLFTKACLSAQACSAAAAGLFSDLGKHEGNQDQQHLTSSLELQGLIGMFLWSDTVGLRLQQTGVMHPQAGSFQRLFLSLLVTRLAKISDEVGKH